jgi:Protein of unknown function (DUF983)
MALPISGDGPAVFIMFLAGAIVVGAALVTEILFQPPYWVHATLWLPLILIVTCCSAIIKPFIGRNGPSSARSRAKLLLSLRQRHRILRERIEIGDHVGPLLIVR